MTSPGQHCGTPTVRYTAHERCEHGRGGGAGHGCDDGARCDTVVHMTLIVAHRGRHDIHPENSPEAFIAAVEQGADGIELDVRCSRDGVPVVHHDPVLADGRVIADTDAESMSDVVCTLVAALDACHGAFVNIEIKNQPGEPGYDPHARVVDAVAAEIERRGDAASRWLLSSFDAETLDRARHRVPGVRTAYLTAGSATEALDAVLAAGHPWWHPWDMSLTGDDLRRAHAHGLGVTVWTCNSAERIRHWLSVGVDAICTDDVATVRRCRESLR